VPVPHQKRLARRAFIGVCAGAAASASQRPMRRAQTGNFVFSDISAVNLAVPSVLSNRLLPRSRKGCGYFP